MARSRFSAVGALAIAGLGRCRRRLRPRRRRVARIALTEHYKTFTAALAADRGALRDKVESDQLVYGAISRHAADARPAFELHGSAAVRPAARAAGRPLLRPGHHHPGRSTATSPCMALFEGSPAYKEGIRRGDIIAKIDGEDAKGWTSDQAVRKLRGPKGTNVEVSLKRAGLRPVDPARRARATRSRFPTIPRRLHGRRPDRLRPAAGLRREHRPRSRPRARRP